MVFPVFALSPVLTSIIGKEALLEGSKALVSSSTSILSRTHPDLDKIMEELDLKNSIGQIHTIIEDITPFINVGVDTEVNVDYNIEEDPYGNYVTEIFFVSYGEPNFSHDASIEEIIAPNNFKENGRFNPICGNPIIRIKNTGSENLTTLNITYGIEGMTEYTYTWEGSLAFLQEEIVELPTIDREEFFGTSNQRFNVSISMEWQT